MFDQKTDIKYLLTLCFILTHGILMAQVCQGNLGINIFDDGDFNTGMQNVILVDPQIAPGYQYQPSPPPNDGFYTITNNTAPWGSFAENWDDIRDNSPDPFGYMMVVNASFEPGLFYEETVQGLCENTLYVFSADVYNLINQLNPNITFLINDEVFLESGQVPYTRTWITYGDTFSTGPGETEVKLSIRNNAPGGNGNDLALDNISFRACGPEARISPETVTNICVDGQPVDLIAELLGDQYPDPHFQWQRSLDGGMTWENIPDANSNVVTHDILVTGEYLYRYLVASNPDNLLNPFCRVLSNVWVLTVDPEFFMITDTICEGLSFQLGDNSISTSGTFEDSFISSIGCDSIVTLELTVVPDSGLEVEFEITDPSCTGFSDGSIEVLNILNGAPPFEIEINGELNQNGGNLLAQEAGEFAYRVSDRFGCSFETTISLIDPMPFNVNLPPDSIIVLGDVIEIIPDFSFPIDEIAALSWQPGGTIDCSLDDCTSTELLLRESQTVSLVATSVFGCIDSDEINIEVEIVRDVFFPNIFSPNGDQMNDFFFVAGRVPNVLMVESLIIFDRYGNKVFDEVNLNPNDEAAGWNGRSESQFVENGVYTYMAEVRFLDEEVIRYMGSVTVVR